VRRIEKIPQNGLQSQSTTQKTWLTSRI